MPLVKMDSLLHLSKEQSGLYEVIQKVDSPFLGILKHMSSTFERKCCYLQDCSKLQTNKPISADKICLGLLLSPSVIILRLIIHPVHTYTVTTSLNVCTGYKENAYHDE